jgi:hypothetical protein
MGLKQAKTSPKVQNKIKARISKIYFLAQPLGRWFTCPPAHARSGWGPGGAARLAPCGSTHLRVSVNLKPVTLILSPARPAGGVMFL